MVEGAIHWRASIKKLILEYQSLVHPVFETLFGWLPFFVPTWVHDYIFAGILIGSSMVQAQQATHPDIKKMKAPDNIMFRIVSMPLYIVFWPLWVLKIIQIFLFKDPEKAEMQQTAINALQWLAAIAICFSILLIFNYKS